MKYEIKERAMVGPKLVRGKWYQSAMNSLAVCVLTPTGLQLIDLGKEDVWPVGEPSYFNEFKEILPGSKIEITI